MRAIAIREWGGRDRLALTDLPAPPVARDGVLVRVRAAGLNPVDWKVREGSMKEELPYHFPLILGWDAAGVVEKVGPAVTAFQPGDEVYGYLRRHHLQFGTYAEYATAPEEFFARKPRSLSFEEAAAIPLAGLTAWETLEALGVRGGETLLVGAGSGGVGHFAVQLGVARGARVLATASPRNHDFIRDLGGEPIDYTAGDVPGQVRALVPDGVDAALDLLGSEQREDGFASLRRGGRLATVARPPTTDREDFEFHYIFVRTSGEELAVLAEIVEAGALRPHVQEVFPLERAADALARLEAGHVRGKLVLRID